MRVTGPDRYRLTFDEKAFEVAPRFAGIAVSKKPKLYVFSVAKTPIYVGVTKQHMRNRLRFGWNAKGKGGYYGYLFRRHLTAADLAGCGKTIVSHSILM